MRPLVCILLVIALVPLSLPAQNHNVDSLKQALSSQSDAMDRMKTSFWICAYYNKYKNNNDDSLRLYSKEALDLASSLDSLQQMATFMAFYATSFYFRDTTQFFERMHDAEQLHLRSNNTVKLLKAAFMTSNIAMQYNSFNQHRKAIKAAQRGLSYLEKFTPDSVLFLKNKGRAQAKLLGEVIEGYRELGDYENSIKTLFQQEQFLKEHQSFSGLLDVYLQYRDVYSDIISQKREILSDEELAPYKEKLLDNLYKASQLSDSLPGVFGREAEIPFYHGVFYEEEQEYEEAKRYYYQTLPLAKKYKKDKLDLATNLALADIYLIQGKLDSSIYRIRLAESRMKRITLQLPAKSLQLYEAYAGYYLAIDKPKKALFYADKSSEFLLPSSSLKVKAEHYNLKHQVAIANTQTEKALEFFKLQTQYRDSLAGKQLAETLEDLQGKYLTSQKDAEIAQLNEEKISQQLIFQRILGAGVLMFLLVVFIAVISYLRNRNQFLKAKERSSELKHRLLRSQMNPHFTFNAIGAIQNYLLDTEQPDRAAYFLSKFAKLMRQILDQSFETLISLEEELDTIQNYLTIQKLRYDSKFEFEINIAESICPEKTHIPPVLIQPLLENAIEHGQIHKKEDGIVQVELEEVEGYLNVKVKDNGVGLTASRKNKIKHTHNSVSTSIIEERINMLKSQYGGGITYTASELEQGGTESILILPKIIR